VRKTILARIIPAGLPSDRWRAAPTAWQAEGGGGCQAQHASRGRSGGLYFRPIGLTGDSSGRRDRALDVLFKKASKEWSFAPSITLPIFNQGSLEASLDVAKIQKRQQA